MGDCTDPVPSSRNRPLVRSPRPSTPTEHHFAVVSDVHLSTVETGTSKQLHRTAGLFRAAIRDIGQRDVDAVVCLGDLVHHGRLVDMGRVCRRVEDLPCPVYGVPGNHDLAEYGHPNGPPLSAFAEAFTPDGYPFSVALGELTVAGLPAVERRIDPGNVRQLAADAAGSTAMVLCLHYPTTPVYEALKRWGLPENLARQPLSADALRDTLFDRVDVGLVLGGHLHVPMATWTGDRVSVAAPPLCTYPQGYLLVRVGPDGCRIDVVPVPNEDALPRSRRERSRHAEPAGRLTDLSATALDSLPLVDR